GGASLSARLCNQRMQQGFAPNILPRIISTKASAKLPIRPTESVSPRRANDGCRPACARRQIGRLVSAEFTDIDRTLVLTSPGGYPLEITCQCLPLQFGAGPCRARPRGAARDPGGVLMGEVQR